MAVAGKSVKTSGMKELRDDIRQKQFRRVYLLFGDEDYLVRQYRRELIRAVCPEDNAMNLNIHRDDTLDWNAVQDEILSMPFFAERRMVVLDDTKLFMAGRKKSSGAEESRDADSKDDMAQETGAADDNGGNLSAAIAQFLTNIPESTVVLFTERPDERKAGGQKGKSSVDKRGRLYKAVVKQGLAVEFTSPDEGMLRKWVLGKLGEKKIRITQSTLDAFLMMTGTDMSHINTECEKIISYAGEGGVIRREDLMSLTSEILEGKIFRMLDMISQRDIRGALDLYDDLLALKESETKILILLMRQFAQLFQVRSILDSGGSVLRVTQELGLSRWQAEKAVRQAAGFSSDNLRGILEECASMQEKIQSGHMDKRLGLEMLILRCAG